MPDETPWIRTYIGPYPPSRPTDTRTHIWSICDRCGWYCCHLEDRAAMQHTIEYFEHKREGCDATLFGAAPQPLFCTSPGAVEATTGEDLSGPADGD